MTEYYFQELRERLFFLLTQHADQLGTTPPIWHTSQKGFTWTKNELTFSLLADAYNNRMWIKVMGRDFDEEVYRTFSHVGEVNGPLGPRQNWLEITTDIEDLGQLLLHNLASCQLQFDLRKVGEGAVCSTCDRQLACLSSSDFLDIRRGIRARYEQGHHHSLFPAPAIPR